MKAMGQEAFPLDFPEKEFGREVHVVLANMADGQGVQVVVHDADEVAVGNFQTASCVRKIRFEKRQHRFLESSNAAHHHRSFPRGLQLVQSWKGVGSKDIVGTQKNKSDVVGLARFSIPQL